MLSNFFEDTFLNINDSAKWLFINVILIWIILASYQSNNLQVKNPDERELFINPSNSKISFGHNVLERYFGSTNQYSEPIDLYFGLNFGKNDYEIDPKFQNITDEEIGALQDFCTKLKEEDYIDEKRMSCYFDELVSQTSKSKEKLLFTRLM